MFAGQRYFIKQPVCIIGFMGAGKTSVGKLLSDHTGIKFVDTDTEIVQTTKQTVSEIIHRQGEDAFRKVESDILLKLTDEQKIFIGTGGGCVESAVSRGILKNCYCVWLNVNAKTAAKRIEDFQSRPMFKDVENAENLIKRRNKMYEQYANLKVDTNNKNISQVTDEVCNGLLKAGVLQC